MQRVVSVWFPHWPTDRLRRLTPLSPRSAAPPFITASHDGRRRIVIAADVAALELGLKPGMAVAQALAAVPDLQVAEADIQADAIALERLARWCHRLTPLSAADAPDGLWLDVTGCSHLWEGEAALLQSLLNRLARDGIQARAAIADTPGAAHALARYGAEVRIIVPPGQQEQAIADLSVAGLRLPPDLVDALQRLGFEQIGHLTQVSRAILARRFGPLPGSRLDQACGDAPESLIPLSPEHQLQRRAMFLDPLLTAEALAAATVQLVEPLCDEMECSGLGARQVDLLFQRVDNQVVATRVGTGHPSRDARHIAKLLNERLETVDPGLGIESMHLIIPVTEALHWEQQEAGASVPGMNRLIDQLTNRCGIERVYRAEPMSTEVPHRSVRRSEPRIELRDWSEPSRPKCEQRTVPSRPCHLSLIICETSTVTTELLRRPAYLQLVNSPLPDTVDPPLMAWKRPWSPAARGLSDVAWPARLDAPARLLTPPRRIEALAGLPDHPPAAFTWRRRRHRIRRADGPERIHGEWWRHDRDLSIRDYYRVEDECGQRFWLFRQGNGQDLRTGNLAWFVHGLF